MEDFISIDKVLDLTTKQRSTVVPVGKTFIDIVHYWVGFSSDTHDTSALSEFTLLNASYCVPPLRITCPSINLLQKLRECLQPLVLASRLDDIAMTGNDTVKVPTSNDLGIP